MERDYTARLAVPCPACGAEPGQQCRRVAGAGSDQLQRPHVTRGRPPGRVAEGRALRARRLQAGWTQAELADAAGTTSTVVSAMERLGVAAPKSWERVRAALSRREAEGAAR